MVLEKSPPLMIMFEKQTALKLRDMYVCICIEAGGGSMGRYRWMDGYG